MEERSRVEELAADACLGCGAAVGDTNWRLRPRECVGDGREGAGLLRIAEVDGSIAVVAGTIMTGWEGSFSGSPWNSLQTS